MQSAPNPDAKVLLKRLIDELVAQRADLVQQANQHLIRSAELDASDTAIEITFAATKINTAAGYGFSLLVLQRELDQLDVNPALKP